MVKNLINSDTIRYQYSGFRYLDYTNLLFERPDITPVPTGTCLPFSRKMFVTVNGKILPCERIGQQFALGIVSEESVNLDLQAIANKYNAYYAKMEKHMEYGTLQGIIETISLVPEANYYTVDIALPFELKTNTGKELNFTGELSGQAEIITDDRSLFERILSPVQYLLKVHAK